MIEITEEEFENNFDSYMNEVENNKKHYLIRLPDGRGVVMAPVDEEVDTK